MLVTPSRRRDASSRRLYDDCSGHMRMQGTKVLVGARCRERECVRGIGIERFGSEVVGWHNRVRNVVLVGPGDRGPRFHFQFLRTKGEVPDLDGNIRRQGRRRGQEEHGRDASNEKLCQRFDGDHDCTQLCSGVSMMARRCSFCTNVTLAMPSMLRSLSPGTFMGPGEGAVPGDGCGKAVERAV